MIMTDREYEDARHIMDCIDRQREEDNQLALIGYIVFLALGFALGVVLV